MSELDKWWATEPFGFDNPDTYNGIKKLLKNRTKDIIKMIDKEIYGDDCGDLYISEPGDLINEIINKYLEGK